MENFQKMRHFPVFWHSCLPLLIQKYWRLLLPVTEILPFLLLAYIILCLVKVPQFMYNFFFLFHSSREFFTHFIIIFCHGFLKWFNKALSQRVAVFASALALPETMPHLLLNHQSSSASVLHRHFYILAKGFGTKPSLELQKNSLVSNNGKNIYIFRLLSA